MIKTILSGLTLNNGTELIPYLQLLKNIVTIQDELHTYRLENLLGYPHQKI